MAQPNAKRVLGFGMTALGLALLLPALFAGRASAWPDSCYDYAQPGQVWSVLKVDLAAADLALIAGAGEQFGTGALKVTLSGATKADASQPLSSSNIGGLQFSASIGVDASYTAAADDLQDKVVVYDPPAEATSGSLTSENQTTPLLGVTFCYDVEESPTTTTTSTTTTTTSTTTTTTTTTAPPAPASTVPPPSVAPIVVEAPPSVEVLPATEEQAVGPEIAFTGSNSRGLSMLGVSFVVAGLGLVAVDRSGLLRHGRHSRSAR